MENLLVIDGNSILNRAFYGIRPLSTKEGIPTNAVYGFLNILKKHIDALSPTRMVCAFDRKAPTFRHKMYAEYKAQRKPMPDGLRVQMPIAKDVLRAMGVNILEKEGYEADDIIGTLAFAHPECEVAILSSDRDLLQIIDPTTSVYLMKKGISELEKMDEAALFEKYEIIKNGGYFKPYRIYEIGRVVKAN